MMLFARRLSSLRMERLRRPQAVAPLPEPVPPPYEGWIDELSARHVGGWMRSKSAPQAHSAYEVVQAGSGELLAFGWANQYKPGLFAGGFGDGTHGFWTRFSRPVSEEERKLVVVRPLQGGAPLPVDPSANTGYEPVLHVAMDIVNNCNLRCPFCLFDYSNTRTTHLMTEATLDAALRFLPLTRDGEFWFSCLHEPTLHPDLIRYIDKVPLEYRRKIFYTTNLSKRMPATYFEWLAQCGVHHINISIESLEPAVFERMRKGARYRIFIENWNSLLEALGHALSPPQLRYIVMAYKSNLRELPQLTAYLLSERRGSQVEIRYTFDVPHIPDGFRQSEFLDAADWAWLREQLGHCRPAQVQLVLPPVTAEPEAAAPGAGADVPSAAILEGRCMLRLSWDGTTRVHAILASSRFDNQQERQLLKTNIRDIADPEAFLDELAHHNA